jgi:hypothetical protein
MTIKCPACKASRDVPLGATLVACACGLRFRPDLVPAAPRAGARSDRAAFIAEREIAARPTSARLAWGPSSMMGSEPGGDYEPLPTGEPRTPPESLAVSKHIWRDFPDRAHTELWTRFWRALRDRRMTKNAAQKLLGVSPTQLYNVLRGITKPTPDLSDRLESFMRDEPAPSQLAAST